MNSNRSRAATLIGVTAAAGAFGVAVMMSAATAPTARADDFSDIITAVEGDFTLGQGDFSVAATDFGSGEFDDGVAALLSGVDEDFVGVPDNLFVGSVDLLTNEPVVGITTIGIGPEPDFASGLADAESQFADAGPVFSTAATDLFSGDYAGAADLGFFGVIEDAVGLSLLLSGAVDSF
jgi:hypothetical protein